MADDAWLQLMAIKSGGPAIRRPRRQAAGNSTDGYGAAEAATAAYETTGGTSSLPRVYPIPPLEGAGLGPDANVEKPSSSSSYGGGQCGKATFFVTESDRNP